ncbi:MAG: alkaline phosphatase family protein [Rhodobacteraceae bacterium]|jgi:predicted AlkP superfamily pyrophosphatase or phosphodiesterase|nr:alkaline phosphatase family protein [Paracoccaceae bacterium]
MPKNLLLIILDGVPYANWRRYFGCLEGWVKTGEARVWRMRASLPSMSGPCYASIHTGAPPQVHGVLTNAHIHRVQMPDVFGQVRKAGGVTGAVTHSWWSEFFNRAPFDMVRDIEYDEPESASINHGRFHTMTAYNHDNQATPCDADLFATLTSLCARFALNYGILHTCTLDSMGHRFGHDCAQMDHACAVLDAMLAGFLPTWRKMGYEVIVTADHGQSLRGHHGGTGDDQQDFALYYFGDAQGPAQDIVLDQLQLAPTVLKRMGAPIADTMTAAPFLD